MFSCPLIRFSGVVYEKMLKYEKFLFLLFLLITLLQLWLTKYIPSLDGPQHLYNATVLSNLLKGDELTASFFGINHTIVGYWTGHFLLAFFTSFLPSWLAEKLFLTTYVVAMIFAFRYLVRSINSTKGNFVSFLIFPFVYHSFILMGYYAFSLAAVFFFLAFGYYLRNRDRLGFRQILVFSIILLLLFLTHGLIYLFFGLSFVILYIGITILQLTSKDPEFTWKGWLIQSLKLILAVLPSFILWAIYIKSVMSLDSTVSEASIPTRDLIVFLLRIRQLVGFHHQVEAIGYVPLFALIVTLSLVWLVLFAGKIKDRLAKVGDVFNHKNIWLPIALVFLALYFFAPDRISAGSLTNRFGLYFFFMIILWLSMQKIPKTFQVIAMVVILYSISYTRITHHRFYKNLNKDIAELTELTESIELNSVVDYKLDSRNWVHIHFQLYAVLDKPLVHLRNVQCWGQFPMVWNYDTLPRCYAGEKEIRPSGALKVGEDHSKIDIDYYTVFLKDQFWNDSTNAEWHKILTEDYQEIHVSKGGKAALYARRK